MKPLNTVLSAWQPSASESADPLLRIKAEWPAIVGPEVAANSRPAEMVRDGLLIVTRSGAWSQQLSFLSERILHALRARAGVSPERLRFRVGRITAAALIPAGKRLAGRRVRTESRTPAASAQDALERFRADVAGAERAKARAGWKECGRCGVRVAPGAAAYCVSCENAHAQERDAQVGRLLFEAPWLGYPGIVRLVDGVTPKNYENVRSVLLRRWRDVLDGIVRTRRNVTVRDRMIASSYVLLKSGLDPERIAPAVVRDLLGDHLHDIFYGTENA